MDDSATAYLAALIDEFAHTHSMPGTEATGLVGLGTTAPDPALALYWLCHPKERIQQVQAAASQYPHLRLWAMDPLPLLLKVVRQAPPPDAVGALCQTIGSCLGIINPPTSLSGGVTFSSITELVRLLAELEREPWPCGRHLLVDVVQLAAEARRQSGRLQPGSDSVQLAWAVAQAYGPLLAGAGLLSEDDIDRMLREFPRTANAYTFRAPKEAWQRLCDQAGNRFLQRALEGDTDPNVGDLLAHRRNPGGMDEFLAACRILARHPKEKPPIEPYFAGQNPLAWLVMMLKRFAPPRPEDIARTGELTGIPADALQTATLLAPAWAPVAEPAIGWLGWGAVVRWLSRNGGPGPWSEGYRPQEGEEEDAGGGIDRADLLEAAEQLGDKRLQQLFKHRVVKGRFRDGVFYANAVLGRNAAEVEEKYLKRSKQAVVALALLPDEGDILQRYLALRRFAKEARQFGAMRQASETAAVERALTCLAWTAGYQDRAQLEWAMEAQLAEEMGEGRTWTISEYTISLNADEHASLRVEREGKVLKSVPPVIRQAEEYAEIKEAREQLQGQWDRVRRRLELAMALGEVMDRQTFAPALTTPAGQAMVPHLVLRCWPIGSADPLELMDFRTADGRAVPVERLERFQVAHPMDLASAGTLADWQAKAAGAVQPFNQLFRECYTATVAERGSQRTERFAGRSVRMGTLLEKLRKRGWHIGSDGDLTCRLPGRLSASIWFREGSAFMGALEVCTMGSVDFYGKGRTLISELNPLTFSEVMRDVDRATAQASPAPAEVVPSPEVLAARTALVRALLPGMEVAEREVWGKGWSLDLATGAAFGPDHAAIALPELNGAGQIPFRDPDPATAQVIARVVHLARKGK